MHPLLTGRTTLRRTLLLAAFAFAALTPFGAATGTAGTPVDVYASVEGGAEIILSAPANATSPGAVSSELKPPFEVRTFGARLRIVNLPVTITGTLEGPSGGQTAARHHDAETWLDVPAVTGPVRLTGGLSTLRAGPGPSSELTQVTLHGAAHLRTLPSGPSWSSSSDRPSDSEVEASLGLRMPRSLSGLGLNTPAGELSGRLTAVLYGGNWTAEGRTIRSGFVYNESASFHDASNRTGSWRFDRVLVLIEGPVRLPTSGLSIAVSSLSAPSVTSLTLTGATGSLTAGGSHQRTTAALLQIDGRLRVASAIDRKSVV